jgi:hypothetical protein
LADAQVARLYPEIAAALFGEDAFLNADDPNYLKPNVLKFMDTLMAHTWQRFKKSLNREQERLEKTRKEISALWQGLISHKFMPVLANLF